MVGKYRDCIHCGDEEQECENGFGCNRVIFRMICPKCGHLTNDSWCGDCGVVTQIRKGE